MMEEQYEFPTEHRAVEGSREFVNTFLEKAEGMELNEWERNFYDSIKEQAQREEWLPTAKQVSAMRRILGIDPKPQRKAVESKLELEVGVYEINGEIFLVKPNRARTRLYAMRLVEAASDRLTQTGEVIKFDFVYDKGAIYHINPEHRMNVERAKQLIIRYGRCIVCGRNLKVAESVERGIGPVCIKAFRR